MFVPLGRFLRFLFGVIDLILTWCVLYPISLLPNTWTRRFYPALFRFWCRRFVDVLNVDLKVHQKNHFSLPKQYIVISNHPSFFEDVGMTATFDAKFVAKAEVADWWFVGKMAKAGGTLFFQRDSKESRVEAIKTITEALTNGENIGIYPEGGCKGRRIHLPFRYGIFEISLMTGVPIIPVFLHYESQEDFEWFNQHLFTKIWKVMTSKNRTANFYIYDAIQPAQFSNKEDYCQFVQNYYLELQKRYLD